MNNLVVFDTNVFVSYLLPSKKISAVKTVVGRILTGSAIPVYSNEIMSEYEGVLNRTKFGFSSTKVHALLDSVFEKGFHVTPIETQVPFIDITDKCFYDAARAAGDCWLITGNKRHFPVEPFIVTAAEYLQLTGGML